MSKPSATPLRHCQPCTACCDGWVRMVIYGAEVYPGSPCPHSTGAGCKIYDDRPVDPCRNFECGWVKANSPLPDWLRPDRAHAMMLPGVRTWQGRPVDVIVPVGKRIPPRALKWFKQFAEQQLRPMIYLAQDEGGRDYAKEQNVVAYGPPEFRQEIGRLLAAGERLW